MRWLRSLDCLPLSASLLIAQGHDSRAGDLRSPVVASLAEAAIRDGNPGRGAVLYAAPTSACLSCHRVGQHGGNVGPDLSQLGAKQKLDHIVESLLWPQKVVADQYKGIAVLTADGKVIRGYRVRETDDELEIRDTATGKTEVIDQDDIEETQEVGSLMPDGLLATMSTQDKHDLIAFLADLGKHEVDQQRNRSIRCWRTRMGIIRKPSTCRVSRCRSIVGRAGKRCQPRSRL